jgi:hypothetical protein
MTMRSEYDANAALVALSKDRNARRGALRFRPSAYMLARERAERVTRLYVWAGFALAVVAFVAVFS